jgi:hypothetical protein
MKFRILIAASVVLFLLFLSVGTGFCANDGKVTMEQWLKIINAGSKKKSAPPKTPGANSKEGLDSNAPAGPGGIAVTVYWHMADNADVYLNGKQLRQYEPSFKTRPDEAPRPAFSAASILRNGDVFTVGGRRGGSFGFMLIAVDSTGRIVFQTDQQSWKVYEPGDHIDWFNPQIAVTSPTQPVTIQPDPWYPQKELNAKYGNKALSIWSTPANTFAYLYGVFDGHRKTADRTINADPQVIAGDKPEIISGQFYQISINSRCLTRKRIKREVELKECTGDDYQLWSFLPVPGNGKSYYQLWDKPTGRCLEVASGSNIDGGGVATQSCSESANSQQWMPQAKGNGVFSFRVRHSGKCLTIKQMRKSPEDPLTDFIVQWTCGGGEGQSWKTEQSVNK